MTDQTPFRPFETLIDRAVAEAIVKDAVAGADDGELFLERRRAEVLSFDDGRLDERHVGHEPRADDLIPLVGGEYLELGCSPDPVHVHGDDGSGTR